MPKKPPPNAFYYYMKNVQDEMRQRGQRVPNMREMPNLVSGKWNSLTPEEKAPYEEMVRAYKRNRTNTDDGKLTSDGIPIQLLRKQEEELEERVRATETAVRNLVKTFTSTDDIAQSSIFIMGFNILVGTLEHLYLPNEIGIVEYSIKDGIRNEYHKFIDPGPIPVGYTSSAKLASETVHEIPISGFALASSNYRRIYEEVKYFLGLQVEDDDERRLLTDDETRYIFCHPNEMDQFQSCLDWLKKHAELRSKQQVVIGNLAVLVEELKAATNEAYPYKSTAVDAISTNSFDYSPNTLCNFHEEKDNKYCALGYCKRLGYILSDILCKPYGIELTSKHLPERGGATEMLTWEPKRNLQPVINRTDVPKKPVVPHISTTIISNVRSKFDDEPDYRINPSALSETSSVVSDSVDLESDTSFPSLSGSMRHMSLNSPQQTPSVNAGPSWAQVSSKTKPMRAPRSIPNFDRHEQRSAVNLPPIANPGLGRSVGIGRGRGLNITKNNQ